MGSARGGEAAVAFELATSKAAGQGFVNLEALSVRDLVEHVMDDGGQLEVGVNVNAIQTPLSILLFH